MIRLEFSALAAFTPSFKSLMQTKLKPEILATPEGAEAEKILRTCVHCGFCNATCPTYQLLGDELDGPRGRIYLIKQMLEGGEVSGKTQEHLDRCLTCRNCESTCPSGVQYGKLLDIGRDLVERKVPRSPAETIKRRALQRFIPSTGLFDPLLKAGRLARPFLPTALRAKVPLPPAPAGVWPQPRHSRRMVALRGCAQPSIAPNINAAAARVLDRVGISLVEAEGAGCCGALRFHLNYQEEGRSDMRRNTALWSTELGRGAEALVMTASGCGVTVREYGHYLQHDAIFSKRAALVSAATRDLSEIVDSELAQLKPLLKLLRRPRRIAFHPPCSLQHGQKIRGVIERILTGLGFELTPVPDAHLCCGSAGTYSILQPELAQRLLLNKVSALTSGQPEAIVSANIGCMTHLASGAPVPVQHWIELVDQQIGA